MHAKLGWGLPNTDTHSFQLSIFSVETERNTLSKYFPLFGTVVMWTQSFLNKAPSKLTYIVFYTGLSYILHLIIMSTFQCEIHFCFRYVNLSTVKQVLFTPLYHFKFTQLCLLNIRIYLFSLTRNGFFVVWADMNAGKAVPVSQYIPPRQRLIL